MRVLVFSDLHDDASTMGVARRPEALRFLDTVREATIREGVDVVAFAGDWADPGFPLYEADFVKWSFELAAASRLGHFVAVAGNHDVVEVDVPLSTLSPGEEASRWPVRDVVIEVAHLPRLVPVQSGAGDGGCVAFLCLPYCARAAYEAAGYERLLDGALEEAAALKSCGARIVSISHLCLPGARLGSEAREMARGRDLDLPAARLRGLVDLAVNGHYHAPQDVTVDGLLVVVPGSPLSFTTDDPARGKGYLIAEV